MVHVKPLQAQFQKEMRMQRIFGILPDYISLPCKPYAVKALCLTAFPPCDLTANTPKPRALCQDDCWVLEQHFCEYEFTNARATYMSLLMLGFTPCSKLPSVGSPEHKKCLRLNLTSKFGVSTFCGGFSGEEISC